MQEICFKFQPRAEAEGRLLRCNKIHCTANFWEVNRFPGTASPGRSSQEKLLND
jgi:hypothetical protein